MGRGDWGMPRQGYEGRERFWGGDGVPWEAPSGARGSGEATGDRGRLGEATGRTLQDTTRGGGVGSREERRGGTKGVGGRGR